MATQTLASKPLDPKASPYHKTPHHHLYILQFPHSPSFYHIPQPFLALSPFHSYNLHLQPAPRKPLPLTLPPPPLPVSEKIKSLALTPVPCGPRIPNGRRRRVDKVINFMNRGGGGQQLKWRPKSASKEIEKKEGFEAKRRWKNRNGEYQQILPIDEETTSLMIKNIPNKYTRKLLIQTLDNHCKFQNEKIKNLDENNTLVSAYDFLYLPIDFNRRVNAGFAFVNFTNPTAALRFKDAFDGKRWDFFESPKIAEISGARIQGKEALLHNFKMMDFSYGSKEDMPVWFDHPRDGFQMAHCKMYTVGKFLDFAKIKSGN